MSGRRVSPALLALLSVLWVGGCSTGQQPVAGMAASSPPVAERVAVSGTAGQARLTGYAAMAEVALAYVEDLWGVGAVRWPVRVVLPATAEEFVELTGGGAGDQAPAVTVGSMAEAHIVVHPEAWDRLTPEGRQAVLTHEVTHLAQQGHGAVPAWLGEGMAEFTAHRHSRVAPEVIAGSALDEVRAGHLPDAWPDPTGGDSAWGGYALSWLACLYIAETWSEDALLQFYEAVAGGTALDEAFPTVLGVSEAEALAGWGSWLRGLG